MRTFSLRKYNVFFVAQESLSVLKLLRVFSDRVIFKSISVDISPRLLVIGSFVEFSVMIVFFRFLSEWVLSFVITCCTTRCHSLSLDAPLVSLFMNDFSMLWCESFSQVFIMEIKKRFSIELSHARNQEFFRAGEVSEKKGTLVNI